jgi:single-stranded DNA-specific DHH superfamily exonuclease
MQVDTGDEYADTYNLDSYLMNTIQSNLDYDGITERANFKWKESSDEALLDNILYYVKQIEDTYSNNVVKNFIIEIVKKLKGE